MHHSRSVRPSMPAVTMPMVWAIVLLAGAGAVPVRGAGAPSTDTQTRKRGSSPIRLVQRFDFDERTGGNLEDIPKYWEAIRPRGFPHYVRGSFDEDLGHLAAPSFHLKSEGRNVGFQYRGPDARVRIHTDYRVEGFIRPDRLKYSRACLSAHFLDRYGRALSDTLVRTNYVGGEIDGDKWVKVSAHLAAAPPEAYTIAIGAWVLDQEMWRGSVLGEWHIPRRDVRGGAWFDDISIYALPQVRISTRVAGNVIPPEGPFDIEVILADDEDPTLTGTLSIIAANGQLVETHLVSVSADSAAVPMRVSVRHLKPGLYDARLDVDMDEQAVMSRHLTFALLAPMPEGQARLARSFGIVVGAESRSDPVTELALLSHQAVHAAKLPLWTGIPGPAFTAHQRRELEDEYQALVKAGFALTGVFAGPPGPVAQSDGTYVRSLVELLNGEASDWMDHLGGLIARYASIFHWWQLGSDRQPPSESLQDIGTAATALREAMEAYLTLPRLMIPRPSNLHPGGVRMPFQQVTLALGSDVLVETISERLQMYTPLGYQQVSAFLVPQDEPRFRRTDRLAHWAQRVIATRHAGAHTVYVAQTWRLRETPRGPVTEPLETYLLLRTIASLIGSTRPGPEVLIADGVRCLAFNDGESSVLAMWDSRAPAEGNRYAIQLGRAQRQYDLWGHDVLMPRDDHGRQIVHLTSMPIIIRNVDRWLIDFRTGLSLDPAHVESGSDIVEHTLIMDYKGSMPVSGKLSFQVPDDWKVVPKHLDFNAAPQRISKFPLEIRYPHNESAGRKIAHVNMRLAGEGLYMEVPLPLDVGVQDLRVWGGAVIERKELLLRHVVTNRSQDVLSFRASATIPGRARQYRPISNLRPGETQVVEYRLRNAEDLAGRRVLLTLREVNDGPRIHNYELTIP